MTRVILRDGRVAEFRKALNNHEDRAIIRDLFSRASPQSLYFRFFSAVREVSDSIIDRMVGGNGTDQYALLCMAGKTALGLGTYHRKDEHCAEVAFLVDDQMQGKGIGTLLLEHLAEVAWTCGFKRFEADVLADNSKMLNVFKSSGYEIRKEQMWGSVHLVLPLAHTERRLAMQDLREKLATAASFAPFFHPKTVAVVGASRDPHRLGHILFRHVLEGGFQGTAYPVNPSAHSVASVRAYPRISDIPEKVDLAILVVPAEQILSVVDDCVAAGVRAVMIVSAGFAERDEQGLELEQLILRKLHGTGCRLIGPNSLGLLNTSPDVRLNASFVHRLPASGHVAIASQSGGLGIAILEYASRMGVGVSSFASTGNRADVSGNDLLQYWEDDPDTNMIILHLESFGNPRKFSRIARRITQNKPLLVVKSARTTEGFAISESRSLNLGTTDSVVEALFRQTGIIRLDTFQEVFDTAALLSFSPLPKGNRVAIVTNTAGGAVMTVDALQNKGMKLMIPPVDLGFEALAEGYRKVLPELLCNPNVDAVIVLFIPIGLSEEDAVSDAIADAIQESALGQKGVRKPVVANFLSTTDSFVRFIDAGEQRVPVYPFPEQAVHALSKAIEYGQYRNMPRGRIPDLEGADVELARTWVRKHLKEAHPWLSPEVADQVFSSMGIRTGVSVQKWDEQPTQPIHRIRITAELDPLFGFVIGMDHHRPAHPDPKVSSLHTIRITPLTDLDAREMAQQIQQPGFSPAMQQQLEDLLLRLSRLVEEVYEITRVELPLVEIGEQGYTIHGQRIAAKHRDMEA